MTRHTGQSATATIKPASAAAGQDQELVKGLGLTSATTLVMGSMIGSGIFIVSADIARLVDSPALLIAAWVVTGFMTIIGALCYGELAAMMPQAGGQYVLPARIAGAAVGIPLRLDAVPGHPDRHDRRGGRGVRQVSRRLFPVDFLHHTGSCISGRCRRSALGRWCWATWTSA